MHPTTHPKLEEEAYMEELKSPRTSFRDVSASTGRKVPFTTSLTTPKLSVMKFEQLKASNVVGQGSLGVRGVGCRDA